MGRGGHSYSSRPCRECEKKRYCEENCEPYNEWFKNMKAGIFVYKSSLPTLKGRMVTIKP